MHTPILAKHLEEEIISSQNVEETENLFWVQAIENTRNGKHTRYELEYTLPNKTIVKLAQIARVEGLEWEAQLTCRINRVLTPLKGLAPNIIQISWIFGMLYDTVIEQCKLYGIFKVI